MENNEDIKTNMMNQLPDEMVIKIFEHFENLAGLSTLLRVDRRFNLLSKQKCNRNHLLLKLNEVAAFSVEEFKRKLEDEVKKCNDLKAVTFTTSHATFPSWTNQYTNFIKSTFIKSLNRNTEDEIKEDDMDSLLMFDYEFSVNCFLKKNAGDMSRVLHKTPSVMMNISAIGTPKLFQTAIEKNTDTLKFVKYKGTNVTLEHLNALGKCKKLRKVNLTGNLVVSEEVPESFETIEADKIWLEGNFHCPYVADLFFSETLQRFSTYYTTIAGFKNELFTKCTKLKALRIIMEFEREDIQNDQLIESIIELVDTLKHHQTLQELQFVNINEYIQEHLPELLFASLESIRGCEADNFPYMGQPAIYIKLKNLN